MIKRSIHFGLDGVDPNAYGGWPGYLNACCNDARCMAGTMARVGFEAAGKLDEACTLAAIKEAFTVAATEMVAGDWFMFSDSGHGGQVSGWAFGSRETLCMYDGQIADDEIHAMLTKFRPGVNVVMVLDSCFSGGIRDIQRTRLAPSFVIRQFPPKGTPIPRGDISSNVVIFAASAQNETSEDGEENGAFTGSFLHVLNNSMTWNDWGLAVKSFMLKTFPQQHPQVTTLGPAPETILQAGVFFE